MGYFNDDCKLGLNVYSSAFQTRLCYKIFNMFEFFFIIYLLLLIYCVLNFVKIKNLSVIEYLYSKVNVLRNVDKKQYLYSDKTELLDIQEKGEYNNNTYDESTTIAESSLQSRKDASSNDNNLEYNHIKL